jgi:hypothetical protein
MKSATIRHGCSQRKRLTSNYRKYKQMIRYVKVSTHKSTWHSCKGISTFPTYYPESLPGVYSSVTWFMFRHADYKMPAGQYLRKHIRVVASLTRITIILSVCLASSKARSPQNTIWCSHSHQLSICIPNCPIFSTIQSYTPNATLNYLLLKFKYNLPDKKSSSS